MDNQINITDLQRFRCFATLSDTDAQALAEHLQSVNIAGGQQLFQQGDAGDCVYLLLSGEVEIRVHVPDHADRVLAVLDDSAIFGEISLLLSKPRTATAIALTDVTAWKVTHEDFQAALQQMAPWAVKLLQAIAHVLAQRLEHADQELVWIITDMREDTQKPQVSKAHELEDLRNRLFTQWSF